MKAFAKAVCDAVEITGFDCDWRATQALVLALLAVTLVFFLTRQSLRTPVVRRGMDMLYTASGVISALFLIAMLGVIVVQMLARWSAFIFPGATNYAGYCMAASSFFGLAYALNSGAHIRVNILLNALGGWRRWGEIWCFAIAALLATYFVRYAIKATILSEKLNDVSQGQDATPLWIPQLAMCVGGALVAMALWDNLFRLILAGDSNIRTEGLAGDSTPAEG